MADITKQTQTDALYILSNLTAANFRSQRKKTRTVKTNQKRAEKDERHEVRDGKVVAAVAGSFALWIGITLSLRHTRQHYLLPALARRASKADSHFWFVCYSQPTNQRMTDIITPSLSFTPGSRPTFFTNLSHHIHSLPASGLTPRLYDWSVSSEHLGFYF